MNQITLKALNISNVIYHNLQLVRQSVNELNYLLNNPLDGVLFSFVGFSSYYFTNLIDIHGRNVVILLSSLFEGNTSIKKMINIYFGNINDIEFKNPKVNKTIISELINKSSIEFESLKTEYYPLIKKNRDKIAAHQDAINMESPSNLNDCILSLEDMNNILPKLEQIFARLYYSLTNEEYVYDTKSFVDKGLHSLYDTKMKDLNNNQ